MIRILLFFLLASSSLLRQNYSPRKSLILLSNKAKRRIVVHPVEEGEGDPVEHLVPKGKHINVQEGDIVKKGDYLMDGNPVPHDILRVLGIEELARYLVNPINPDLINE